MAEVRGQTASPYEDFLKAKNQSQGPREEREAMLFVVPFLFLEVKD